MRSKGKQIVVCFITFIFLTASQLFAMSPFSDSNENQGPGHRGPGRKPPVEAYEACKDKEESNTCSMQTPHGEMTGSCRSIQGDLVCAPKNIPSDNKTRENMSHNRSARRQPAQEAFDVCENHEENDSCEFETVRGVLSGTCQVLQGKFVCAPKRH